MFKKIANFVKTKLAVSVQKSLSVEEQYHAAADELIKKIFELKRRHATIGTEIANLEKTRVQKTEQRDRKIKEIKYLMKQGTNVETHAKLAMLYERHAEAITKRIAELQATRNAIDEAVVGLDDRRTDLAVKLELIRESRAAGELGINTEDDVFQLAELTSLDVEEVITRVQTFTGDSIDNSHVTNAEVAEFLERLKD